MRVETTTTHGVDMIRLLQIAFLLGFASGLKNDCRTRWTSFPDSTLNIQSTPANHNTEESCLSDCLNLESYLAVSTRRNEDAFVCLFYENMPHDFKPFPEIGTTLFIKTSVCYEHRLLKRDEGVKVGKLLQYSEFKLPAVGPPGPPGPQGPPGPPGAPGISGRPGFPGYPGYPGIAGSTGMTGPTGETGMLGNQGGPGNTGFIGTTGERGDTGSIGNTGPIGPLGTTSGFRRKRNMPSEVHKIRKIRSVEDDSDYTEYCNMTWTINNNSDYRDAYNASIVKAAGGCIDKCRNSGQCIGVDIQCTINTFCVCWLHRLSNYSSDLNSVEYETYAKNVACSKFNPATGPPGVPGPPGPPGLPGWMGFDGEQGEFGSQGLKGEMGDTGDIGRTGIQGDSGYHGFTGSTGPTGIRGAMGDTGATGATGPRGSVFVRRRRSIDQVSQTPNSSITNRTDYCMIIWKKFEELAFREFYKSFVRRSVKGCIDICRDDAGCLAVEIDSFDGSNYFICWLHNNPEDFGTATFNTGFITYIKVSSCYDVPPIRGPQGPPGTQGERGPPGEMGQRGIPGMKGSTGPTGYTGVKGMTGETGLRGLVGDHGATGIIGYSGIPGDKGDTGPTGETGPKGWDMAT